MDLAKLRFDKEAYGARKLGNKRVEATGWPAETWVLYRGSDPGDTVGQLDLYMAQGKWFAWTEHTSSQRTKDLGKALARKRNKETEHRSTR